MGCKLSKFCPRSCTTQNVSESTTPTSGLENFELQSMADIQSFTDHSASQCSTTSEAPRRRAVRPNYLPLYAPTRTVTTQTGDDPFSPMTSYSDERHFVSTPSYIAGCDPSPPEPAAASPPHPETPSPSTTSSDAVDESQPPSTSNSSSTMPPRPYPPTVFPSRLPRPSPPTPPSPCTTPYPNSSSSSSTSDDVFTSPP